MFLRAASAPWHGQQVELGKLMGVSKAGEVELKAISGLYNHVGVISLLMEVITRVPLITIHSFSIVWAPWADHSERIRFRG